MKIGKYIIEIVPYNSFDFELNLPIGNNIYFKHNYEEYANGNKMYSLTGRACEHIKPNTGIRYSILGKYWIFLVIKQEN